jgi:hypothetical protein
MAAALKEELATACLAGPEHKPEIERLAEALAAENPTAAPAHASAMLQGRWRLLYSTLRLEPETTLARLSFNTLPKTPVRTGEVLQEIDPARGAYDNIVVHDRGALVTLGEYRPSSDNRLDVRFTELLAVGEAATRVPIDNAKIPPLWSDVIYLDEDLRLNRGGFGNLYVLELVEREPQSWWRER